MIKFCTKCIMPNSRPRIQFNKKQVCNACSNSEKKSKINWQNRKKEFSFLVDKIKEFSKKNSLEYDCIVPWSGGKDSSSIALKLKLDYGLNPLLVTFSPLIMNVVGQDNRIELQKIGFDNIFISPNQKVARLLARRFFIERGNPKVAWDAGVNSSPMRVAIQYKIPYIFYVEHGESEYGGLVLNEESLKKRDLREVIEHQIGDYPENWISKEIEKKDLYNYIYPSDKEINQLGVTAYYYSYFFKWSMLENYNYVKEKMPSFKENITGRTKGTFTDFDSLDDKIDCLYYYMQFIKFGFGRATRDSCRMIQNNQMTREKAIQLARRYDNEFPIDNFKEVLDYLSLKDNQFEEIVDKHRNNEIWKQHKNRWELNFKI